MPFYCYTTDDGVTVEEMFPMGKAPDLIEVEGRPAHRDIVAEHRGFQNVTCSNYPYESNALGVPVHAIGRMRRHLKKCYGIDAQFNPQTGDRIISSRGEFKRDLAARGMHDKRGFD